MSIWNKLFDSRTPALTALPDALRTVLQSVQKITCPYFGTCAQANTESESEDQPASDRTASNKAEVNSVAFTVAAIVLSAKLAKADGRVTRDEVATFRQLFTVPESEKDNVGRLFNQARQQADGFERYANQVAKMFEDQPQVLTDLLGCLITICVADGRAASEEIAYLRTVSGIFGVDEETFQELFGEYSAGVALAPLEDPYLLLGVAPSQPLADIRRRYRTLVRESHPDRLRALDLPEERIEAATDRMVRLNAAWEDIQKRAQPTNEQELVAA